MELGDYRAQIDEIDHKLVELFAKRMDVAAGIAAYKKEHSLPVLDPVREREKLQKPSNPPPRRCGTIPPRCIRCSLSSAAATKTGSSAAIRR